MIRYKVAQIVKRRGFSARHLAAEAGISPNTAARLIKAKSHRDFNISIEILDKVCRVLKCKPGDLLEHKKEKRKK